MKIKRVMPLTNGVAARRHRAMPALASTRDGELLIAYREGSDHVDSADGSIYIMRAKDGYEWTTRLFTEENPKCDMRVDHGMALIDGTIYLPYQEYRFEDGLANCRTIIVCSEDGKSWRIKSRDVVQYYFFPYGRVFMWKKQLHVPGYFINEYTWKCRSVIRKPHSSDGEFIDVANRLYYRFNEMDICRYGDEFIAAVREEKNNYSYIVKSPYGPDNWQSPIMMSFCIQSPCLLPVRDKLLLAGRELEPFENKFNLNKIRVTGTSIRESLDGGYTWSEPLMLDRAYSWDCGYPSAIEKDGLVYIAFYSEFVQGNSNIMLAEIEV